ncbi:hypothetical protein D3C87_650840 [compost metagenome]
MYRSTDTHVYFLGGFFSQWAKTPFTGSVPLLRPSSSGPILRPAGSLRFNCCEQFMMAGKAMVFNDQDAMLAIMDAEHPAEQKKLGRTVKNFDQAIWEKVARDIVYIGNFYKFAQHTASRDFLDESQQKIIVEGADYDPVWGVKIAWDDPAIEDEANWKGTNWLGQCIMRVRDDLAVHGLNADPWKLRKPW